MKPPFLITSDLHLTANPNDNYRWSLFPWLVGQGKKYNVDTLLILGDLTDAKDYHSSVLVNKIVSIFSQLSLNFKKIIILMGNHDYLKDSHAYFSFLREIGNVEFLTQPESFHNSLFLPYTKDIPNDWKDLDFSEYDYVFMHQTVKGALASNGQEMDGELQAEFKRTPKRRIYSGDIHVPQDIGNIRYVGSPYHVHFGDNFNPRVLLVDENHKEHELYFPSIKRVSIKAESLEEVLEKLAILHTEDQVKVKLTLTESEAQDWHKQKQLIIEKCKKLGVRLFGVELKRVATKKIKLLQTHKISSAKSPNEALVQYVEQEDLGSDILNAGLEIMKP